MSILGTAASGGMWWTLTVYTDAARDEDLGGRAGARHVIIYLIKRGTRAGVDKRRTARRRRGAC